MSGGALGRSATPQLDVPRSVRNLGYCLYGVSRVLPMFAWLSSGFPVSSQKHDVRWNGCAKSLLGGNECVCGFVKYV